VQVVLGPGWMKEQAKNRKYEDRETMKEKDGEVWGGGRKERGEKVQLGR